LIFVKNLVKLNVANELTAMSKQTGV
jgi:hypothetical protein